MGKLDKLTEARNAAAEKAKQLAGKAGDLATKASDAAKPAIEKAAKKGAETAIKAKDKLADLKEQVKIEDVIETAAKVPGVRIDRDSYLTGALSIWTTEELAREAVEKTPALAGIPEDLIDKLAEEAIAYENNLATATSVAAGLPSSVVTMIPATIADLGQFYAHVLRVAQKLGYLYGWKDLFELEGDQMDDATRNTMVLFLGVMSGVQGANKALLSIARSAGTVTGKRVARQALTKGTIYPIIKKICYYLGIQMNKGIFGRAVGKSIPILGGGISGLITRATFAPMAKNLKDYLKEMPLAKPENAYVLEADLVAEESFEEIAAELDAEIAAAEEG